MTSDTSPSQPGDASQRADRPPVEANAAPRSDEELAAALRGFGPLGILAILVVLSGNLVLKPLSAVLVLAWARWSRTPWSEIGYARPKSWIGSAVVGIVFGVAFKLVMKSIVMPLLGADPINQTYHYLVGNTAALPGMVLVMLFVAGFGEETLFRGYLFERLGKLLGSSRAAKVAIVLLTGALFGADHFQDQGLAGAQQATIVGIVFGGIYVVTRRLWMLMWAHAAFDLAALAVIYWDLEEEVAHFFFR